MTEQDDTPADKPKRKRKHGNANSVGRPFFSGDSRINRKGRPKSFDALRREAIKLAGEIIVAQQANGEEVELSRIHKILLDWAGSDDPQAQKLFVEYAFGKVPNKEEITGAGGNELTVRYVNDWRNPTTNTTHRTNSGDEGSGTL